MVTKSRLSRVFGALSDPTRRAILELLREGELPAAGIAQQFREISRPGVSKHLRILREAELVEETRQGRNRIYRLRGEPLEEAKGWLGPLAVTEASSASPAASMAGRRRSTQLPEETVQDSRSAVAGGGDREDDWRAW
jgi:DNA-binding transcriptional ArsR family regulator